jgi:hypothetical protein
MVQNRTRKTMRHFQCRDDLWGLFEKMAVELECSIDYLINEAMRQYARSRKYAAPQAGRESSLPPEAPGPPGGTPPQMMTPPPGSGIRKIAPPPSGQRGLPSQPPRHPPMHGGPPPAGMPGKQPMAPSAFPMGGSQGLAKQQTMPMRPPMDTDPMGRAAIPQPHQPYVPSVPGSGPGPMATPSIPHSAGTVPTLYLIFNGQRIPITKEQFIIGRGLKTSDLAIKDGNISRKHAAIIYHNGAYYIKDLGSVNGIEFAGKRIDSKRIDEGDIFHICDYELRFTYK